VAARRGPRRRDQATRRPGTARPAAAAIRRNGPDPAGPRACPAALVRRGRPV